MMFTNTTSNPTHIMVVAESRTISPILDNIFIFSGVRLAFSFNVIMINSSTAFVLELYKQCDRTRSIIQTIEVKLLQEGANPCKILVQCNEFHIFPVNLFYHRRVIRRAGQTTLVGTVTSCSKLATQAVWHARQVRLYFDSKRSVQMLNTELEYRERIRKLVSMYCQTLPGKRTGQRQGFTGFAAPDYGRNSRYIV